ncbi:MAG: S-layer homology domain-containing protein [Clostridia bacterium]|nr:S-layer homology domain-containing protein [Clostridia bacterium]
MQSYNYYGSNTRSRRGYKLLVMSLISILILLSFSCAYGADLKQLKANGTIKVYTDSSKTTAIPYDTRTSFSTSSSNPTVISGDASYTYDTFAHRPYVEIPGLTEDVDYTVAYSGDINATVEYGEKFEDNVYISGSEEHHYGASYVIVRPLKEHTGYAVIPYGIEKLNLGDYSNPNPNITYTLSGSKIYDGTITHPVIEESSYDNGGAQPIDLKWKTTFARAQSSVDLFDIGAYYVLINGYLDGNNVVVYSDTNYSGYMLKLVYVYPAPMTCTWQTAGQEFTYNGEEQYITPTLTGVGQESILYKQGNTSNLNHPESIDVGEYDISVTPLIVDYSAVTDAELLAAYNNLTNAALLNNYVLVENNNYTTYMNSADLDDYTTVNAYLSAHASDLMVAQFESNYSIVGAPLTVTANDVTVDKGDPLPALDFTITGEVGNEKATKSGTASTTYDTNTAGTFPNAITVSNANVADTGTNGFKKSNYRISLVNGTLTVNETTVPLTITAANKEKYYGEPDPELTATTNPSVTPGGALTRESGEDVGEYTILQGTYGTEAAPAYDPSAYSPITYVPGTLTIKKTSVEPDPDPGDYPDQKVRVEVEVSGDYTYDGQPHKPHPTVKLVDETGATIKTLVEDTDYTLSWEDYINAGKPGDTNPPTVIITGKGNFAETQEVEYTIKPRPLTVTADDINKVVGDALPAEAERTITTSGEVAGETPTFSNAPTISTAPDPLTTATTYPIEVSEAILSPVADGGFIPSNYNITYVNGTLTVTEAPAVKTPLYVRWSDQDTFQYDTFPHVRVGAVYTGVSGETVDFELIGWQTDVGNYVATIRIKGIKGGRASLEYYDTTTVENDLERPFKIVALPVSGDKPTEEPHDSGDPIIPSGDPIESGDPYTTPSGEPYQPQDYTVRIEVVWPDTDYVYSGDNKEPVPEKVEIVVIGTDNKEVERKPLPSGDYKIEYKDNKDAKESGDENPPTATLVPASDNITGEIPFVFPIKPRPLVVTPDDQTGTAGDVKPEGEDLTYKTSGEVAGETPTFEGYPEVDGPDILQSGEYPIVAEGHMTPKESGDFKPSNYDITYEEGTLTVTEPAAKKPLYVRWSDQDTFQYDTFPHIRVGVVYTGVSGETVDFELTGWQTDVGEYRAQISVNGIIGGDIDDYDLRTIEEDLIRPFRIIALPVSGDKPTEEPHDSGDPIIPSGDPIESGDPYITPSGEPYQPQDYKVRIEVVWPDTDYIYSGDFKEPVPEKVEIVVIGPDNKEVERKPLPSGDYKIEYKDNKDAKGSGDENPPTATLVPNSDNITGEIPFVFPIAPRPLVVTPDDQTGTAGDVKPEGEDLTYKTSGEVAGETPTFEGYPEVDGPDILQSGEYPIVAEGHMTPKESGDFKPSNYDITFEEGTLTVSEPAGLDKIYVKWSDQDTFQYDGQPHIRIGIVYTDVDGETVDYTLTGWKVDAGEGYIATITINGINGGRGSLDNYDTTGLQLTNTFKIKALPLPTPEPTEEPQDSGDPMPSGETNPSGDPVQPQDYTVVIEVKWPSGDYIYSGDEKMPVPDSVEIVIYDPSGDEVSREPLPSGDYTIVYENNIDAAESGDPVHPTARIVPSGDNITGEIGYPFTIKPRPLDVEWNEKDTFQYDGKEHIRIGKIVSDMPGVEVEYTLEEMQIEANTSGEHYTATLTYDGIKGGKASNFYLPDDLELEKPFTIVPLPISEIKPTEKPINPTDPLPDDDQPDDYTVEVEITWPDPEIIYTGKPVEPVPDKVELIIKNPSGDVINRRVLDPDEYTLDYENNVPVGESTDPNPPTIIIIGDGKNITGQVPHPFTITPAPLTVKADNKTKTVGRENPTLTYTVTGAVNGEVPAFDGTPTTTCTKESKKGTYPIVVDGELVAKVEGTFDPANYNITYVDGILTVKSSGGGTSTPVPKDIDVSIFLSNGKREDKGNNNYYLLGEEVVYYVDYENLKEAFSDTYKLTLELPLPFEAVELDGGKVSGKTITWTIPGGMKVDETGRKTVKVKFTAFSSGNKKGWEDIYPVDRIYVGSKEYDECTVHNIIYTLDNDIDNKHIIYMYGDEEKPTFRPDDIINRAEGALVLTRIFEINTSNVAIVGDEFTDIGDTYLKAQQAIVKASQLGLIAGYEDGSYRPLQKMTRAEFMSIISRFVEYKSTQEGIKGMDIKEIQKDSKLYKKAGHWADKYILLLARLNMAPEDIDTMESLNRKITRAEVAQLCNMYLLRAPVKDDGTIVLPFNDVDSSHKLWGDIIEATRQSHNDFRLTEDAYEIWNH